MYIRRILIAIALLGAIGLGIFSYYIYNTLLTPNTAFDDGHQFVHVKTGASYASVYEQLKPLLKNPESFDVVAEKKSYVNHVKPGRFKLKKDMSNNDIINTLRSKNSPLAINFNNQERLQNLAGRVSEQLEADSTALMAAMTDSTFLATNDFTLANALNMYIPNQYQFYWNTSAEGFRKRMLKEYKRFWTDQRLKTAKKDDLTPQQVQIIASIVQKETAMVEERKRVAGVYINRFKRGIKLDADPTVIYALKKKHKDFDTIIKRVLYKDLDIKSPYNTYLNSGLPPGPITMPDISSIDAVLHYEKHDFYYFVADPERPGYHKFAKSLRQHNRNKRAYSRWINKMGIMR